ncbi:MAG: hypothetical protein H6817_10620 [Phycisphaerales bacterium]|nr:hypothetical protein [Phycisphaerales bacterium]
MGIRCQGKTIVIALFVICAAAGSAYAGISECTAGCGDLDGDGFATSVDFALLNSCIGEDPQSFATCACADLDGNGAIDLADYAIFMRLFAGVSDEAPPDCTGAPGTLANLTAYRPQHGTAYFPFARTAVPDDWENDEQLGPGIRINNGDADPSGEDDLIEVVLTVDPPGAELTLRKSTSAMTIWTTRNKQPGTNIVFPSTKSVPLPVGPTETSLTLWVEWESAVHGVATLQVEPAFSNVVKDSLTFHTFHGIVLALGGEGQVPTVPVEANSGTFVVGTALYGLGFDVHMYDEDNVSADGSGAVYNETATAIQHRLVDEIAIFGYSHGGGSTYSLADRLDVNRAGLGLFTIGYTSYVDSVRNNSDIDVNQELRRPPSSAYHLNHYQHGSFFEDLGLDGGPVTNSNPPPTGLDVETTPWGANSTHFEVDDYIQVRSLMESTLTPRITR